MKLVEKLKRKLEEFNALTIAPIGTLGIVDLDTEIEYDLDELEDRFREILDYLGFKNIDVKILSFDDMTGDLLVRFINPENKEEVDVLFTVANNEIVAAVVSEDDEPIEVNLTNLDIPLAQYFVQIGIDWDEPLTWLKKSVVYAFLEAGKLLNEVHVPIFGKRKAKLPLVKKGLHPVVKHNLKRLKNRDCKRKGKVKVKKVRN